MGAEKGGIGRGRDETYNCCTVGSLVAAFGGSTNGISNPDPLDMEAAMVVLSEAEAEAIRERKDMAFEVVQCTMIIVWN